MGALTVVGLALALSLFISRSAEGTGTCGERRLAASELIAYGYNARAGAWPWYGAMFHKHSLGWIAYACGVTILTKKFVLTAAYCTYERQEKLRPCRVVVKVGFTNRDLPEYHVQQFKVDKIIRHKEYVMSTFKNDIALLKLHNEITYNSYIQPVCLWQGNTELSKIVSKIGYVVGWGVNGEYILSERLNEATMPIASGKKCKKIYNWYYYFESRTFCAGHHNGTHVSHENNGGGLYMRMGSNWVLRGLVGNVKYNPKTWIIQASSYTIFTDVAYYLDWIKKKVHDIPYFAVDTEQITDTYIDSYDNLLDLTNCGDVTYRLGTQEEGKVAVNQYPWEAVIEKYNQISKTRGAACFGILIQTTSVIGSASCFTKHQDNDEIVARFRVLSDILRIHIQDIFIHPKFSLQTVVNNIAIARLEGPPNITPICLPLLNPLEVPDATQLNTIGMNLDDGTRYFRNVTQLVDLEVCKKQYVKFNTRLNLTGGHACSAIEDIGLMYYLAQWLPTKKDFSEGQYSLAAFSILEFRGSSSIVFTNVAYYSTWIREMIEQNW